MSAIFFKLLFKAMTPIVILIGIMTYMTYMQGQDPLAPFRSMSSGLTEQIDQVSDRVTSMASNIKGVSTPMLNGAKDGQTTHDSRQRIYRWIGKDGVPHFGASRPDYDTKIQALNINPATNVVESFKTPTGSKQVVGQKQNQIPDSAGFMPMTANPTKIKQMLQEVNELSAFRLQKLEEIQ